MPQRFELSRTVGGDEEWWIEVYLFEKVENMGEVQQRLMKEALPLSLINPEYIPSALVLQFAAVNALHAKANNSLKCHSIFAEMLYMLYPTANMRQAFKSFGVTPNMTSILVVRNHGSSLTEENIQDLIHGSEVDLSRLSDYFNEEKTKKLYQITPQESRVSTMDQSIITRLMAKDYL